MIPFSVFFVGNIEAVKRHLADDEIANLFRKQGANTTLELKAAT